MFLEILVERRDRRCRFAVDAVERLRRLNPWANLLLPLRGGREAVFVFRLRPTSVGATAAAGSEPWDQTARAGERPKGFWIWDLRFCDFANRSVFFRRRPSDAFLLGMQEGRN